MPRFFFHLEDDQSCIDEEGLELADADAALSKAIESARAIMSDDILHGRISLGETIRVTDQAGATILKVPFRSVVDIDQ